MTNRQPVTEAGTFFFPTHLLEVVGKALYGWSDDEPNEATGYTTIHESAKVATAVYAAGYRLAQASQLSEPRTAELVEALAAISRAHGSLHLSDLDGVDRALEEARRALAATGATAPDAEREE